MKKIYQINSLSFIFRAVPSSKSAKAWSKLLDAIDLEPKGEFSAIHPQSPVWKRDEVACTRSILNRFPFSSTNSAVGTSDSKAIPRRLSTNSLVDGFPKNMWLVLCLVAIPSCTSWGAISTYSARGSNPPCSWDAWSLKTVAKCVGTKPGFGHPKSCPYTTCPQKRPEETTTYLFQTMPMYGTYNSFSNQLRVNWVGNLWRKRGGKFRLDSFR